MKKLLLLLQLISISSFASNYYISVNGNDENTGLSIDKPLKTIQALNQKNLIAGDSVLFERNSVFKGTLNILQSGTNANPIIISAYGIGENPILNGSSSYAVTPKKGIYCPKCSDIDNLVIDNDQIYIPARYPNEGYIRMTDIDSAISFTYKETIPFELDSNTIVVAKTEGWVIDRFSLKNHHNKTITVGSTLGFHDPYKFQEFHGFFLSHQKKFMDREHEWYFDKNSDSLYLQNTNLDSISISEFDNGIEIGSHISNVTIENIVFKNYRKDGISLNDNSNIKISNCDFSSLGNDGIGGMKNWNSKNSYITISHCTFKNILNTSIHILYGKKIVASHNKISRIGLIPGEGMMHDMGYSGIVCPDSSIIEWNVIDSIGYSGINTSSSISCEVRYNEISNFGLTKNDCGGVYCWSGHHVYIHHNYIHDGHGNGQGTKSIDDIMNVGIYIDDKSHDIKISNNTVTTCDLGINIHNAYNNTISYNTLYNNQRSQLSFLEGRPYYGNIIKNNIVEHNSMQGIYPSSLLIELISDIRDVFDFSSFDNNSYNHPYHKSPFLLDYIYQPTPDYDHKNEFLNFEEWKNRTQSDFNSKGNSSENIKYGEKILGENLILNSNFNTNTGWWWDYGNTYFKYNVISNSLFEGKVLQAKYTNSDFSGSHLGTSNFEVEKGNQYLLQFKIKGTKKGFIKVSVSESDPPYTPINLSGTLGCVFNEEVNEYEIPFKVGMKTSVSLIFHSTSLDGDYFLDDVELHELSYDTLETEPKTTNRLFNNPSNQELEVGIPTGYVHLNSESIDNPIKLAPFTSIVLKKSMNIKGIKNEQGFINSLKIYPNPAREFLYFETEGLSIVELINTSGTSFRVPISDKNKLNISSFPSGLYILKIPFESKTTTAKFIKF